MQFSFEYCIDPKDQKSEEEIKAIAVEGFMWPKFKLDVTQDRGVDCNRPRR